MKMRFLSALAFVFVGLAGRALIDKVLAVRGGAEMVAVWAQLASLLEIVAGVSLAGIGIGLTGLAAGQIPESQRRLLAGALRLGLPLSGLCLALLAIASALSGGNWLPAQHAHLAGGALLVGWLAVAPGLLMALLLGGGRPGVAAALSASSYVPPLIGIAIAEPGQEPLALLLGHGVFGAALTLWAVVRHAGLRDGFDTPDAANPLRAFVLAGLAIGVLSPVAVALARSGIAASASWEMVGSVQALWRSSDWISAVVAGLLNAYYLPRLAAASDGAGFRMVLAQAGLRLVLPAVAALGLLWAFLPEVLALLYRVDLQVARIDALAFFLGDALRMASWIFLFGLFARSAGHRITAGEFFSLPLFALLIVLAPGALNLHQIGLAWLLTYAAYLAFNAWALCGRLPAR